MKKYILLLAIIIVSCKTEEKTTEKTELKTEVITVAKTLEKEMLVYDYNQLEPLLNKQDDKTYVINFWATWCAPCVKELPYFEQLNAEYADKNVEVILVSLDFPKMFESRLKPFIIKNKLQSQVIALNDVDSNSWIPKISKEWSGAIPATLVYNKSKRQFYEQSFNFEEIETEVKQFLN